MSQCTRTSADAVQRFIDCLCRLNCVFAAIAEVQPKPSVSLQKYRRNPFPRALSHARLTSAHTA
jgi:hypothetical protein